MQSRNNIWLGTTLPSLGKAQALHVYVYIYIWMMELKDQNETTETTSEKELGAQSLRIKTNINHVSGYVSNNGMSKWDNISWTDMTGSFLSFILCQCQELKKDQKGNVAQIHGISWPNTIN